MPKAGISVITWFFKLLGVEEDSRGFVNRMCRGWNFTRPFVRGEITSSEAQQLIVESGVRVAYFQPGVLDAVRACGGQFEAARLTTIPGGETLKSQRDGKIIKFWTDWHFKKLKSEEKLTVEPSIASEAIYLPNIVEGSLRCTYDRTEGQERLCVEDIIGSLPKVEGLRWIIGNTSSINRVLANHSQKTMGQEYLLRGVCTWTTDTFESPEYGRTLLIVGSYAPVGVDVSPLEPFVSMDDVGLFVLGVPA